jgi:hypothetical protein
MGGFPDTRSSLRIFQFEGQSSALSCVLQRSELEVLWSAPGFAVSILVDFAVAENRWFELRFVFDSVASVVIYGDGWQVGGGHISAESWIDPLGQCSLFGHGDNVECAFRGFTISTHGQPLVSLRTEDSQIAGAFEGTTLSPRRFWEVFEFACGMPHTLCLFANLDRYPVPYLMRIVLAAFLGSPEVQDGLLVIHGFELMAHCFVRHPRSLTLDLFTLILEFQNAAHSDEVRSAFLKCLLLNVATWRTAPIETQGAVLNSWTVIANSSSGTFRRYASPLALIEICCGFYESGHMTPSRRRIVFRLLGHSLAGRFDRRVFGLLESLFVLTRDSPDDLPAILQTINTAETVDHGSSVAIASWVLQNQWLMTHSDPRIHSSVAQSLASVDVQFAVQHILANIRAYCVYNLAECAVILRDTCAVMVSAGEAIENVEELFPIPQRSPFVHRLLPFAITIAHLCDDAVVRQFASFLLRVLNDKQGLDFVIKALSPTTLLLLVGLAVLRAPLWNDFLIPLLAANVGIHASAFELVQNEWDDSGGCTPFEIGSVGGGGGGGGDWAGGGNDFGDCWRT